MNNLLLMFVTVAVGVAVAALDLSLYVAGAVVGTPAYVFLVRRPVLACAVLAVASNVTGTTWVSPSKISGVLLIPPLAYQAFRQKSTVASPPWFMLATVALALWLQVCDLFGIMSMSYDYLVTLIGALIIMTLMHQFIRNRADLSVFVAAQAATLALVAVTVPLFITTEEMEGMVRTGGLLGEPNSLANAVARLLPFLLGIATYQRMPRWARLGAVLAVPACMWALFGANSRSGTLAMIIAVLAFGGLVTRNARNRSIALVGAIGAAVIINAVAPAAFHERTIDILISSAGMSEQQVDLVEATSGRHLMNLVALDAIAQNPLVGLGSGGFVAYNWNSAYAGTRVHNAYLGLGAWGGLPALLFAALLHIYAIAVGWRTLVRSGPDRPLVAACLAAGAGSVASLFNSAQMLSLSEWTIFAMCSTLPNIFPEVAAAPSPTPDVPRPETRIAVPVAPTAANLGTASTA